MKNLPKWLLIVGTSLVLISLVFSINNLDKLIKPFYDESTIEFVEKEEILDTNIKNIIVGADSTVIKVIKTDDDILRVKYSENKDEKYRISRENNTFIIKNIRNIKWFSFNINFALVKSMYIEIYVPTDRLETLNLRTIDGTIKISNIDVPYIDSKATNGTISLSNVNSNNIEIKTTNGKIDCKKIISNSLIMTTTNGSITAKDLIVSDEISAKNTNGNIDITSSNTNSITLRTTNGGIEANIGGINDDYKKDIKTTNGSIRIDDIKYQTSLKEKTGNKNLFAKTTNGGIRIYFTNSEQ